MGSGCIAHLVPYFSHHSIHKMHQENFMLCIILAKDRVSLLFRKRVICYLFEESFAQGMLPFGRREIVPKHDKCKYHGSLANGDLPTKQQVLLSAFL